MFEEEIFDLKNLRSRSHGHLGVAIEAQDLVGGLVEAGPQIGNALSPEANFPASHTILMS